MGKCTENVDEVVVSSSTAMNGMSYVEVRNAVLGIGCKKTLSQHMKLERLRSVEIRTTAGLDEDAKFVEDIDSCRSNGGLTEHVNGHAIHETVGI